jgi:monothiol glutaredoxin
MKGNPAQPQCGFSRAVVQILDVQGVPMEKMHTYNCLDDQELREGIKEYSCVPFASSYSRFPRPMSGC